MARSVVPVTLELYGAIRLKVNRKQLDLMLPSYATRSDIAQEVARVCPLLIGHVVRDDLNDITDQYALNLNGVEFLDDSVCTLVPLDSILLISSQAGG
jgi:hypothetical protein